MINVTKHKLRTVILSLFLSFIQLFALAQNTVSLNRKVTLMGSIFQITIVAHDTVTANNHIDLSIAEIERIENLISEWRPQTQISQVNQYAGIAPVKVDSEVFELTKRAIAYSKMTNGAFDISIVAMDRIWKFDGSMDSMPSEEDIRKSVQYVDYQNIILDSINSTIFLKKEGMKIGFGSIGKGFAADKTRAYMQSLGIKSGIINASGDIATWGTQPNANPWLIGINNPFKRNKIIKILKLGESAVATSGSYEKYAEIDDKRYSHIINPKTGIPATGLTSVTIYGSSAEFANALSTSIMVLGEKEGKKLVKQYPQYKFLFITDKGKVLKR